MPQTPPPQHTTWTPTPASKNEPPGWTSPTGRHYTSEHQDWEPPHWPTGAALTCDLDIDDSDVRDFDASDFDAPENPGVPDAHLPPDPFPDWHLWLSFSLAGP